MKQAVKVVLSESGELNFAFNCPYIGQSDASAFLQFKVCCAEEGITIEALKGCGPFDLLFQEKIKDEKGVEDA